MSVPIFTRTLLEWYSINKRILPWRETTDPYRIWISEIILQQTRVAQGYDYYLRFIERFPDVASLAAAPEDEVLKYWQGLGYYSRARNLHTAAKGMKNAVFPTDYAEVRALKGVGDYTAAAICSFAYNMPYAVVDGNVYRVLARYFGIDTPIDSAEGKKMFAALADEMLYRTSPSTYNQAIMDFGALQCTPQAPDCLACPLLETCVARKKGTVSNLPIKQHKIKTTNRFFNYIYVRSGEQMLLRKRAQNDIWRGLYELPLIETRSSLSEQAFRELPELHEQLMKNELHTLRLVCRDVKHVLSHQVIYANFYELTLPESSTAFPGYIRVSKDEWEDFATSRLVHTFLAKHG